MFTNATRPANESELLRIRSGEALPSNRNRAGSGRRSLSTRSRGNSSGFRCTSSTTTKPCLNLPNRACTNLSSAVGTSASASKAMPVPITRFASLDSAFSMTLPKVLGSLFENLLGEPVQAILPVLEVVPVIIHVPDVRDALFLAIRVRP